MSVLPRRRAEPPSWLFLAGAAALAFAAAVRGWRPWLWWLAPVGMTIAGLTMIGVPLMPTFLGQVAAGVLGIPRRWPWWTGVGVALLMPIMFLLPLNTPSWLWCGSWSR